ncbi:hypothetical protein C1645_841238 [Glomus cerebriforme]|uniref:Uncharacterized protein n=1 Tax=Glomus cerebriforme TaxID=658196 RepID=A0A397RZU2_9GLOM|nr:hypothetical protein C1645_841238 [Glomus cerebriforme]
MLLNENLKVYSPYVFHCPNIFCWKGQKFAQTIILIILVAIVTYLYKETPIHFGMKPSFITILGLVVNVNA